MDPTRALSFGTAAELYARARPSYAEAAVRFCLPAVPCRVADVGAGTGKLTEALLRLGCEVVAIEPDEAMRVLIAGAESRAGTAESLPLECGEVDAIVCGQAFHWFDAGRFVAEAARVLHSGGSRSGARRSRSPSGSTPSMRRAAVPDESLAGGADLKGRRAARRTRRRWGPTRSAT